MDGKVGYFVFLVLGSIAVYFGYQYTGRAPRMTDAAMVARQGEYQAALDESQRTGKPVVLDFYADWCGPCRWMQANTWNDPRVARVMTQNFVFVSVNVDHNQELARLFSVSGIPRVVAISPEGKILASQLGALPPDRLLAWLPPVHPAPAHAE